jgi:hypothetical protein
MVAADYVVSYGKGDTMKMPTEYSDEETGRRANEALHRALTTPYKPQRELVGKKKRKPKSAPKAPKGGEA